jgi:hypothetical protein
MRQSSPSGVQTWELASSPKGPDDSIALADMLHRVNQRANAELIKAQDRSVAKNLPPPGKIRILAYDVDPAGRRYATKWMNEKGQIRTDWLLLGEVRKW